MTDCRAAAAVDAPIPMTLTPEVRTITPTSVAARAKARRGCRRAGVKRSGSSTSRFMTHARATLTTPTPTSTVSGSTTPKTNGAAMSSGQCQR